MMENFKLKVFRVVADTLNFRRAADELNLLDCSVLAILASLDPVEDDRGTESAPDRNHAKTPGP